MNYKNKISAITNLLYGGMLMQEIVGGNPAKRPEVRMFNLDGLGATTVNSCNALLGWGCQVLGQNIQPNSMVEPDVLVRCVNSGMQYSTGLNFRMLHMNKPILTVNNGVEIARI